MLNSRYLRAAIAVSVLSFLSACAGTPWSGFESADSSALEKVKAGQIVPEAVAQIAVAQHPEFNGGITPARAFQKIQELAISCQIQMDAQLAGAVRSGVSGALSYGVGGLGTGPAASAAFGNAVKMGEYATYGGITYILPGFVNGLYSGGYSAAAAKGDCTRQFWTLSQEKDPTLKGTIVAIVYAGKSSAVPPNLERLTPIANQRNNQRPH